MGFFENIDVSKSKLELIVVESFNFVCLLKIIGPK